MKKRYITLLSFLIFVLMMTAQNRNLVDVRSTSEKTETDWSRQINEISQTQPIVLAEGISYNANAEGILLSLTRPTSNVKLFALTGEVFWSGNLVQGRFFIPAKPGIYFLRINNKSYKVVCK